MPQMNGFEAIKHLKADKKYADIPVIFASGISEPDYINRGRELGAVDFITKHFSEQLLLECVRNHLG
jgi:CheY-like chemotaxis protein